MLEENVLTRTEELLGEGVFAKIDLALSHDAVASSVAKVFYDNYGKIPSNQGQNP